MFDEHKFGIEIEFTGITREKAAGVAASYFGSSVARTGGGLHGREVAMADGRKWKVVRDGSILCQKRDGGMKSRAPGEYSVELVSPVLTYREDIGTLQGLVRRLRKAGGFTNGSCGIHVHLDGGRHTPRSICNFVILVASRNSLFYKALQIAPERQQYCRELDRYMVGEIARKKPGTFRQIEEIWYARYAGSRSAHYHSSRYCFLNLHSFFHGNGTVELRGFNSTLHAGKVRSYVVFALAMDEQALTQKDARYVHVQEENEKFAMRTYLVRIGFIGDEFKSCREHLCRHLDGNAAWRYGSREACRSHCGRAGGRTEGDNGNEGQ